MEILSASEYAKREGVSRQTIFRRCQKGSISGAFQVEENNQTVWKIPIFSGGDDASNYDRLMSEWIGSLQTGVRTGKPLSETSIKNYCYGINRYWKLLGVEPSIEAITAEQFEEFIRRVPHDREGRQDHYASKQQTYLALRNLFKFLIAKELKTKDDLDKLTELKPKPRYEKRKTSITEEKFLQLVRFNGHEGSGQTQYDRELNRMILFLLAFAGLRRQEAVNLKLADVSLRKSEIRVIDGKGNKDRLVGIMPELDQAIQRYLKHRPQNAGRGFLLSLNGEDLSANALRLRFERLARRAQVDITPHGLRRSCATFMSNRGMPPALIQLMLGHNDLKTTQGYLMHTEKELIAWMRRGGFQ